MSDSEAFTVVTSSSNHRVSDDWEAINGAHGFDADTSLQAAIRREYASLALTVTVTSNVALLQFAAAGHATADLDIVDESVQRYRYFYAGNARRGIPDQLVDGRTFAKYLYKWGREYFIVYVVQMAYQQLQYILKEPAEGETIMSRNSVTDNLIAAVGEWQKPADEKFIYVYDTGRWQKSRDLYEQVQKSEWKDVILNEEMKKTITELMHKFFDSEAIYKDLGVPWKRGVIFHGPAGNGKTISIKALMHSLFEKYSDSIPSLYVKSAPQVWDIRYIFQMARYQAPCLLIFEDIDTVVTRNSRSYFFNEVDGLENNDGIFMVASTNHLDQLDPGLSSRPSRFDRKYLFPLPSEAERIMYCDYWREKLKHKPSVKFPKRLSSAIAGITQDFSFAYLKEAFVATLLAIAGNRSEDGVRGGGDDEGGDLDDYELWREMKRQVRLLRQEMDTTGVKYHVQEPMDLAWRAPDDVQSPATTAPAAFAKLPFRPGTNRAEQNLNNPRLTATDCDSRFAPLMTDGGMFVDSRFDGISSARVF